MKQLFPQRNYNAGFTLIELLVVFSVATILMGIGFVSFVSYSRSQEINQVALNIKLLVQQAKFNSLSSVKTVTDQDGDIVNCGTDSLDGYRVTFSTGNRNVRMYQLCDNSVPQLVKTVSLPSGLSFGTVDLEAACATIQFESLSARASGVPCGMKIQGFQAEKDMRIDLVGNVNVQ